MRPAVLLAVLLLCGACAKKVETTGLVVAFAGPLPVGKMPLAAFPSRFQGWYVQMEDSLQSLLVQPHCLVRQEWTELGWLRGAKLDSVRKVLLNQPWQLRLGAQQGDSARVRWWETDTIFTLVNGAGRLGKAGSTLYLNSPAGVPGTWRVQRLRLVEGRLELAAFTDDTLRLAVLDELGVQWRMSGENGVNPQYLVRLATPRQSRQLLRYEGLWELPDTFQKK